MQWAFENKKGAVFDRNTHFSEKNDKKCEEIKARRLKYS